MLKDYREVIWDNFNLPEESLYIAESSPNSISEIIEVKSTDDETRNSIKATFTINEESNDNGSYDGWSNMVIPFSRNTKTNPTIRYRASDGIDLYIYDSNNVEWKLNLPKSVDLFNSIKVNFNTDGKSVKFPLTKAIFKSKVTSSFIELQYIGSLLNYSLDRTFNKFYIEKEKDIPSIINIDYIESVDNYSNNMKNIMLPNSITTINNKLDSWNDDIYLGYQKPEVLYDLGMINELTKLIDILDRSQKEYYNEKGVEGFFKPIFDISSNSFRWEGLDQRGDWGEFQYNIINSLIRLLEKGYVNNNVNNIIMKFIKSINTIWNSENKGIITKFNSVYEPNSARDNTYYASILAESCIRYLNIINDTIEISTTYSLLNRCLRYLNKFTRSGSYDQNDLAGTFSVDGKQWNNMWGSHISYMLSLLDANTDENYVDTTPDPVKDLIYKNNPSNIVILDCHNISMDYDTLESIHKGLGLKMFAFHYYITKKGDIISGRPERALPCNIDLLMRKMYLNENIAGKDIELIDNTDPVSSSKIFICLEGNTEIKDLTQSQYVSLENLCANISGRYRNIRNIHSLNEYYAKYSNLGSLVDMNVLRSQILSIILPMYVDNPAGTVSYSFGKREFYYDPEKPVIGNDVKLLQIYLSMINIPITIRNGIYDLYTYNSVRIFQKTFNLEVDGRMKKEDFDKINELIIALNDIKDYSNYHRMLSYKSPMMIGDDIITLQNKLSKLRYDIEVTGSYDSSTETIVKSFQHSNNLTEDGIVGPITWKNIIDTLIVEFTRVLKYSNPLMEGPDVLFIQTKINDNKRKFAITTTSVSGIYDKDTYNNVRKIQMVSNMVITGEVDENMWKFFEGL
ncbi:hypothetical protein FPHOBKDP_00208 [Listeria phage LPJP1]|nr:hypothetical protein FPHOBKDP_00208 [Listeria phage LPJP1]